MKTKVACLLLLNVIACLKIVAQPGNYRSRQSGLWTSNVTWERDADLNGTFEESPAAIAPTISTTAGSITISNAHTVTVGTDISADQVTIVNGGTLLILAGVVYTVLDGIGNDLVLQATASLSVEGTLTKTASAVIAGTSITNTTFLSGSRYRHLNTTTEGGIPLAVWDTNATLEVSGFTTGRTLSSSTWSQNFGNIEWNCQSQASTINLNSRITSIQGNFSILATNGFPLQLTSTVPTTITVGGDLSASGNTKVYYTTNGILTLNIGGDFIYNVNNTSGSFFVSSGVATANIGRDFVMNAPGGILYTGAGSSSTGTATLNITRDFILLAGSLVENGSATQCVINFSNGTTHNLTNTGTITGTFDYFIGAADNLIIGPNSYIAGVNGTGVTSDLIVNGVLTVQSADALGAIRKGLTLGNIRTPYESRVFNPGATIIYNNPSSVQAIGDGHPSGPGVNVILQNPLGVVYASNVNAMTVEGDLILADGSLTMVSSTTAKTLTIGGNASTTGGTISSSGPNTDINVVGSGNVTLPFLSGFETVRNLTINKTGNPVIVSNLTVTGVLNLVSGNLAFNNNTLTLRGTVSYGSGRLAANAGASLVIAGPTLASAGTLLFDPVASTLGTLTITRSGASAATISSPLTIASTLNLTSGNLTNAGGLLMGNGATIVRTSSGSLLGGRPENAPGQSWNVTYSGSTTTTGFELPEAINNEDLNNLTINNGPITLAQNIIVNGALNLNGSTLNLGGFRIVMEGTSWNDNAGTIIFNSNPLVFNGANTTIGGSSLTAFRDIQVTGEATVTLPQGTMNVQGNIVVDAGGQFDASGGTIRLNGSTLQTISANGATLHNVTVDKPSGLDVLLLSDLNITGTLLVQSANSDFASNGFLTIVSTSDGSFGNGSIGPLLNNTTVSGNVTIQRYWSAEGTNNRYISSPVTNASVSQLQDDFWVTGPFLGSSYSDCGPFPCLNDGFSLKYYDEPFPGPLNKGYRGYPQTDASEILYPGRGYLANMWEESPETWDVTGPINSGMINFPISHTFSAPPDPNSDGWNLIGNPYPSSVIWDDGPGWTRNQIAPIAYVPDLSSGSPGVFRISSFSVPNAGDIPNDIIATGQAFWVYANTPGASMSINEQAKTSNTGVFFREKSPTLYPVLAVSLTFGSLTDNSFIVVHPESTENFDINLDGYKLEGEELAISIVKDRGRFVLHAVPTLADHEILPLAVKTAKPGKYSIRFESRDGFDMTGWQLYDRVDDEYFEIADGNYGFDSKENIFDRFFLIRGNSKQESEAAHVAIFPNPASDIVNVRVFHQEEGTIYLLDALGNMHSKAITLRSEPVKIDINNLKTGVYLIKVITRSYTSTHKLIKK